jgi:Uncharacterized protein conserved in bacteria (DUF2188)
MSKDKYFVEKRDQGDYAVRTAHSQRASAVCETQAEAIARTKELSGGDMPHVERVRHTTKGGPDKWRK